MHLLAWRSNPKVKQSPQGEFAQSTGSGIQVPYAFSFGSSPGREKAGRPHKSPPELPREDESALATGSAPSGPARMPSSCARNYVSVGEEAASAPKVLRGGYELGGRQQGVAVSCCSPRRPAPGAVARAAPRREVLPRRLQTERGDSKQRGRGTPPGPSKHVILP